MESSGTGGSVTDRVAAVLEKNVRAAHLQPSGSVRVGFGHAIGQHVRRQNSAVHLPPLAVARVGLQGAMFP
jgi:hypothetical protein